MGQANKRGTFEQRQAAAYDKVEADIDVRKKENEELDAFAEKQEAAIKGYAGSVARAYLKKLDESSHPLVSIDFSHIPLKNMQ